MDHLCGEWELFVDPSWRKYNSLKGSLEVALAYLKLKGKLSEGGSNCKMGDNFCFLSQFQSTSKVVD